jgi:two-component system, NtrC family, nitrogen regulation sensor histidine kinase NtrY
MIKRLLLYLVAALTLLAAAMSADQWDEDTALLEQYAAEMSAYLDEQLADAQNWLNNNDLENLQRKTDAASATALQALSAQDHTLLRLQGDSLIFWSNTHAIPPRAARAALSGGLSAPRVLQLPTGQYAAANVGKTPGTLALIPVRYALGAAHPFPAGRDIPKEILFSGEKSDYPVMLSGHTLGYLSASATLNAAWLQWVKLLFFGLFLMLMLAAAGQAANGLAERFSPMASVAAVLLAAGGIVALNRATGFAAALLGGLSAFSQKFDAPSWLGASLGDWLLSVGLFAWASVFFYRNFRLRGLSAAAEPMRWAATGLGYFGALLMLFVSAGLMRHLIFWGGITFDFDNLLNLSGLALWAMAGLLVWTAAAFFVSHRFALLVKRAGLSLAQRGMAIGAALAALLAMSFVGDVGSPLHLLGFGVAYAAALDFFAHDDKPGFGWVVVWLLLLSLFSAMTLYRFNAEKDRSRRLAYAEALATDRDTEAVEKRLPEVLAAFQRDSAQLGVLLKPFPFKADVEDVRAFFNQKLFAENYLFQHYRLQVYGFDKTGQPLLKDQTQSLEWALQENWNAGRELQTSNSELQTPNSSIRLHTDKDGKFRYMLLLRPLRMGDPTQPAQLFCFLDHEYPKQTRVYARLFYNTPYKALDGLARYDYAVEKFGNLVVESGQNSLISLGQSVGKGQSEDIERPGLGRLDAVHKSADGSTVAVVGRPGGDWYKPLYLFSMLFALASVFLFAMVFANRWLRFLPKDYRVSLTTRGSLSKRIHYWTVALIAGAFFVISLLTYRQFSRSAEDNEQANLAARTEAVAATLRAQVLGSSLSTDSLRRTLPRSLAVLAGSFAMDANLYAPSGDLMFSTQPDLRQAGVLAEKMSGTALFSLKNGALPALSETERLTGLTFSTQYLPLRDGQNRLLGFLGVPYDAGERRADAGVSDFLGMLASLYVFLLLTAFGVSFLLAQSIIKPLRLVSEKIRDLQLDNNEQLVYRGDEQDEINELIERYNVKVLELEASKVKMVKLEREGAWREMARQVAHDIKNPLTTMKLSMQQLERVSNNPEQAAAFLRKAITRLIEQIDSLAQIASEFSMFANLDIRERHPMSLNDAVESVFDLFSEQKHLDFELSLPREQLTIAGDKNHLIRVLNNLVINATQSIPSDRRGKIRVSLVRQGETAVVQISDNGGGIPAEIQGRVFEPNFTTKTSGSGLGLAICRKIIEGHDGTIRFETRENEGTDFMVELPVTAVGKVAALAAPALAPSA